MRKTLEGGRWPAALGGESFVKWFRKEVGDRSDENVPEVRRWRKRIGWEEIEQAVLRSFNVEVGAVRRKYKGEKGDPKDALVYLGVRAGGLSQKEVGERLGLRKSAVGKAYGRAQKKREECMEFQQKIDECMNKWKVET